MKQLKFALLVLITLSASPCYGTLAAGFITREVITGNMTTRSQQFYASDGQNYTSGVGGIIFTYPAGWFTLPPIVQTSVLQNVSHSTNETYIAEISSNTATSTTIMVYQVSFGVVNEAPSNSVTVCLLAIADSA